jgi:hypothetical protein
LNTDITEHFGVEDRIWILGTKHSPNTRHRSKQYRRTCLYPPGWNMDRWQYRLKLVEEGIDSSSQNAKRGRHGGVLHVAAGWETKVAHELT